jgi:hypothetical protein
LAQANEFREGSVPNPTLLPSIQNDPGSFAEAFSKAADTGAREALLAAYLDGKPGFFQRRRVAARLRKSGVPYDALEDFIYGVARLRRPKADAHPLAWLSITLSGYLGTRIAHFTARVRGDFGEDFLVAEAAAMDGEADGLIFDSVYDTLRKKAPERAAVALDRVREVQRMTRRLRELPAEKSGGVPLAAVALAKEFQARSGPGGLRLLVLRLKAERVHRKLEGWGRELEEVLAWREKVDGAMHAVPVTECAVRVAASTAELLGTKSRAFWGAWNPIALEPLRPADAAGVVDAEAVLAVAPVDPAAEFRDFTARHPGDFARRYFLRRALGDLHPQRSEWARRLLTPKAAPGKAAAASGAGIGSEGAGPSPDGAAAETMGRLEKNYLSRMSPPEALRLLERMGDAAATNPALTPPMRSALERRMDRLKKTLGVQAKSFPLLTRLAENLATIDQRTSGNPALGLASKIRYCRKVLADMKDPLLGEAARKLIRSYELCSAGEWPYAKCLADEAKMLSTRGDLASDQVPIDALADLLASAVMSDTPPVELDPVPESTDSVEAEIKEAEDPGTPEPPGENHSESAGMDALGDEKAPPMLEDRASATEPSMTVDETSAAVEPIQDASEILPGGAASPGSRSVPRPQSEGPGDVAPGAALKTLGVHAAPAKAAEIAKTSTGGKAPAPAGKAATRMAAEVDPVARAEISMKGPPETARKSELGSVPPVPSAKPTVAAGAQNPPAGEGEDALGDGPGIPVAKGSLKTGAALLRQKAERFDLELRRVSLEDSLGLRAETPQADKERLVLGALRSFLHAEPQTRERLFGLVGKEGFNPRAFLRWLEKHWLDALTPGDAAAFLDLVLGDPARLTRLMEGYPGTEALLAEPDDGERARARLRLLELLANVRDSYRAELDELARFKKLFDGLKEIEERHHDASECLMKKAAFLAQVMENAGEALVVRKKARQILGLLLLPDEEAIPSREALLAAAEREYLERGSVTPLDGPAVEDLISTRVARESALAEAGMEKLRTLESFSKAFLAAGPATVDTAEGALQKWLSEVLLELFRRAWVPAVKQKFLARLTELLERRRLLSPPIQKILEFHAKRLERYRDLDGALAAPEGAAAADDLSILESLGDLGAPELAASMERLPARYRALLTGSDPDLVIVGIRRAALEDREKSALLALFQTQCEAREDWPAERREGVSRAVAEFRRALEESKAQGAAKRATLSTETEREAPAEISRAGGARPPRAAGKAEEAVDSDAEMKEFYKKMDLNLQGLVAKHASGNPRDLFNEQYHFLQRERGDAKSPELRTFILKTVIPRINYAKSMMELLEKLARFTPAERSRSHFARVREDIEAQYLEPLKGLRKDFNYFNAINFTARYKDILKKPLAEAIAAGLVIDKERVAPFLQKVGLI